MSTTANPTAEQLGEAVLLATPVNAAASGGNLAATQDSETSVLVRPDQASEFAERIGTLLFDTTLDRSIAARAQTDVRAKFDIDRLGRAISAIFREGLA